MMMNAAIKHTDSQQWPQTVIVGLGQTGLSCVRFLAAAGKSFAVMDSRETPPCLDALRREFPDVQLITGRFDQVMLHHADEIIVSPGVAPSEPYLLEACEAGINIVGDIELFCRQARAPVVAITGANGKSTVATMVYQMAKQAGLDVRLGGNIGTPALDLLTSTEPDLYVLELSSFQLDTTPSLNVAAAVVLNVSPDHMDRYGSIDAYISSKEHIYSGDGIMVINNDDPIVSAMCRAERQSIHFSSHEPDATNYGLRVHQDELYLACGEELLMPTTEMQVNGIHNILNAVAALALAAAVQIPMPAMLTALRQFKGLPHRCQRVIKHQGVDWVNDSKGTNVGATVAALTGLGQNRNVILIAGGVGKGADFSTLADAAKGITREAILFGADSSELAQSLQSVCVVCEVTDLQHAVIKANEHATENDIVLFSPACASFDMFPNYEVRGDTFVQLVHEVLGQ